MTAIPSSNFDMACPIIASATRLTVRGSTSTERQGCTAKAAPAATRPVRQAGCVRPGPVKTSNGFPSQQDFHPMRICVFGAGAVGSHFAVRLALAGHDVSCVMRGAHLDAVKANGLTLRVGNDAFKAKVTASSDPAELGPQDAVICTLKATGLPSLADGLKPLLGRGHGRGVRAKRRAVVVRYRAFAEASAGAGSRLPRSRRTPARRDPETAYRRRRGVFVQ